LRTGKLPSAAPRHAAVKKGYRCAAGKTNSWRTVLISPGAYLGAFLSDLLGLEHAALTCFPVYHLFFRRCINMIGRERPGFSILIGSPLPRPFLPPTSACYAPMTSPEQPFPCCHCRNLPSPATPPFDSRNVHLISPPFLPNVSFFLEDGPFTLTLSLCMRWLHTEETELYRTDLFASDVVPPLPLIVFLHRSDDS